MGYPNDLNRLGGPPGLYSTGNRDRESSGGIITRICVPNAPSMRVFPAGPFDSQSLNESSNMADAGDSIAPKPAKISTAALEAGVILRQCNADDRM